MAGKRKSLARGSLSREAILSAAQAIVRESGAERLSMRAIAERLECSVASPYLYFSNQEEIIGELLRAAEREMANMMEAASAAQSDPLERLAAIARTYWEFARGNSRLHALMIENRGRTYKMYMPTMPRSYRIYLRAFRDAVRAHQIPLYRMPAVSVARILWNWIYGTIVVENTSLVDSVGEDDPVRSGLFFFGALFRDRRKHEGAE
ncbi:MAG: TetR/AcrR family transcriptional regulator [Leptospirales bacterium]|nr:TetR/AcrR family transcriptional regulator [Leptospirales bacterium]